MSTREPTKAELTLWLRRAGTIQRKADALFAETMKLGVEHDLTDYTEGVREHVEMLVHALERSRALLSQEKANG
jgi:hypothetical protein